MNKYKVTSNYHGVRAAYEFETKEQAIEFAEKNARRYWRCGLSVYEFIKFDEKNEHAPMYKHIYRTDGKKLHEVLCYV